MKNVVVTGAAGGIGRAICLKFLQKGFRVIGIDRAPVTVDSDYEVLQFDLSRLNDAAASKDLAGSLGSMLDGKLSALINNAAVQVVKPVESLQSEDWMLSLGVNLLAPFGLVQMFLSQLREARGSVVNIGSIHAELTKDGFTAYSTSKGALVALTRALALELAPEVRVNAVMPAATDTDMLRKGFTGNEQALDVLGAYHPLGRIARAEEVASLAWFLSSEDSSFITGEAIRVDGGIGAVLHDPGNRSKSR